MNTSVFIPKNDYLGVRIESIAALTACFGKSLSKNALTELELEYHLSLLDGLFVNYKQKKLSKNSSTFCLQNASMHRDHSIKH